MEDNCTNTLEPVDHCEMLESDEEISQDSDASGYVITKSDISHCSDADSENSGYVCMKKTKVINKPDPKRTNNKKPGQKHKPGGKITVNLQSRKSVKLARNRLTKKCDSKSQTVKKGIQKQCKQSDKAEKNLRRSKRKLSQNSNTSRTPIKPSMVNAKKRRLNVNHSTPEGNQTCMSRNTKKKAKSKNVNSKEGKPLASLENSRDNNDHTAAFKDSCVNSWLSDSLLHLSEMEEQYLKSKKNDKKNGVIITERTSRRNRANHDKFERKTPKSEENGITPNTENPTCSRHAGGIWKTLIGLQD